MYTYFFLGTNDICFKRAMMILLFYVNVTAEHFWGDKRKSFLGGRIGKFGKLQSVPRGPLQKQWFKFILGKMFVVQYLAPSTKKDELSFHTGIFVS